MASDEKDLIYTRSNIRHEQVYLFPITMPQTERSYLSNIYIKQMSCVLKQNGTTRSQATVQHSFLT